MTEPAATGVGAELRRAREARGLALADVAQQLKFAARQLEALEEDRYNELPGGTFARGMVRSYARLLKLDPEPLLARIADRFDAPDSAQLAARYRQPVPFSDHARRSTLVYLGLSLGILALGGGVAYQWYHERNARPQLAFVSPAKAPAAPPAAPLAVPIPAQPASAPAAAPAPQAAAKPAPQADAKPAPQADAKPAPQAAAKPAPAPRPVTAGPHRIVIQCDEEAWIEVRNAEDRLFVSSLTPAGSERVVQGRGPFSLVIGNSRYVRVTLNDQPVDLRRYAKYGEVARLTLP